MALLHYFQVEYIVRILIAGLCGGVIGYERKNRMKEAGIRTHFIVAVGAALMMVVSKYGFDDLIGVHNISIDPSRVAAQIVSGIGFLGAGVIFIQSQTVIGLTTAAGLWATSGIGMAIGSGLYSIGIASTVIIIVAQMFLHKRFNWLSTPKIKQLSVQMDDNISSIEKLMQILRQQEIQVLSFKTRNTKIDGSRMNLDLSLELPWRYDTENLIPLLQNQPFVSFLKLN